MDAALLKRLEGLKIPNHIAFIMDGNGRWATARGEARMFGHIEGAKAVERMMNAAVEVKIPYVSFFAFSTENWERPKPEVDGLMKLFVQYLRRQDYRDKGIRFQWAGEDDGRLPADIVERIRKLEADTAGQKEMVATFCINYGGRQEIIRAVKAAAAAGKVDGLNVDNLRDYLYGGDRPDVDLVVRTSGENRISNFMLWQLAYAEMYFPKYHWPEFTEEHLVDCIEEFNRRERRFGAIREEQQ
jgi:undecaprenyl diphosphate synthase